MIFPKDFLDAKNISNRGKPFTWDGMLHKVLAKKKYYGKVSDEVRAQKLAKKVIDMYLEMISDEIIHENANIEFFDQWGKVYMTWSLRNNKRRAAVRYIWEQRGHYYELWCSLTGLAFAFLHHHMVRVRFRRKKYHEFMDEVRAGHDYDDNLPVDRRVLTPKQIAHLKKKRSGEGQRNFFEGARNYQQAQRAAKRAKQINSDQ